MKTSQHPTRHRGATIWEVLIVVGVLLVLGMVYVSNLSRSNRRAPRITCVSNLKQIGLAFRMWSNDHGEAYPWAFSTNGSPGGTREFNGEVSRHFQIISNELHTPKVLVCPSDKRRKAIQWSDFTGNQNLSYFAGLDTHETNAQTILSGDRNLTGGKLSSTGVLTVTAEDRVGWTKTIHQFNGNIGLGDGSAHQMTSNNLTKQFQAALQNTGQPTHRLALPQ